MTPSQPNTKTLGQIAYETYPKMGYGITNLPWSELNFANQTIWNEIAEAVYLHALASPAVVGVRDALLACKRRIAFIGWPNEALWNVDGKDIPDWRKEIALIESALAALEKAMKEGDK